MSISISTAAGERDRRRLEPQRPGEHEGDEHRGHCQGRAPQQHPIGDHPPCIHAHDEGPAFRARTHVAAPGEMNHDRLQDHHHERRRRDVDDEAVEIETGLRADHDVGRIADQRRGAADVGGEHLGEQKRIGFKVELLGDDERHRHDQKNGADVVEER
ncbi:MAG TPA: hypothetical protein VNW48_00135 [Xanthobacteraceae bacterium]|nr:hypothetical protein [Xanthobacteraceae bacterium]